MIPAEAVEAAERAAGCVFGSPVSAKEMEGMIKILEAAAPHMLAAAWDEGWDAFAGFDSRPGGPYPANPYRPTP